MPTARQIRRLALVLLALYSLGIGTLAFASCGLERTDMAQVMLSAGTGHDCDLSEGDPHGSAVCAAHCNPDVQFAGIPPVAVASWPDIAVLVVEPAPLRLALADAGEVPPPGPPHRILLHAFLV